MKLNELNLSHVIGDFGASALKQAGNRLAGNTEGNLSVKDKMAKEKFIADFIGRANTNLTSAIKSGLVDPNIKANPAGGATPLPQQSATPQPAADVGQQPTAPQQPGTPKTPEEIRKEKLAAAGQVAQQQMANNPAPTQQAPAQQPQQSKMTPQQIAALKGRLKAGATATSGQSGFKNYVGGSGERMTGVDKSGAPVFQKIQRESTYSKLDYILESIINIDEAAEAQSISEYLQNMFNQYLKLPKGITDPKAKQQVKTLADAAQASYPNIKDALTKLANLGFAISYSQGTGATQATGVNQPAQKLSALDAMKAGVAKGLGQSPASTTTSTAEPSGTESPAYNQVMSLVSKLSKEEKQKLLATLQEPSSGGAGAFDQMKNQLLEPKSTSNPVDTRQQKLNVNKVKAGNKGAPTPDEEAKLQQRIQQQLAKQA